ncbi:leucine-rich repeat-containing protein 27-like [Girardinichthys multiradiatus]|uniref:leucine-rich repeat-containing protein 27-like n=1 Tax=Girardinichthys multiradiatus TaxID=208333 RepID=UPI001FAE27C7|nr:leucine-rich repeat-containing protein 27-like [Girardinichthys multiradiatus]
MTSFDKAGETQQRFVFGDNSEVNLQRKHIPPEDTEPQEEPTFTEMVCLRRSNLTCVPDSVLKSSLLTYLCLEGNQISSIPGSMFCSLPQLQWLDLRKNLITSLPADIGSHRSLRHLLLEANPISELPAELGNVITLRGLSLRDCPIHFPPKEVLHQGCRSILHHLRTVLAQREVTERKSLPAEEQLQLSELTESSVEEQDESADEDGLQKFRELKDELIQLEKAEMASMGHSDQKSRLLPVDKRKGSSTKIGIIPELHLLGSQYCRRSGEREEAAQSELRKKHTLLEERKEALQKCDKQAKTRGRQRKGQEADSKCLLEGSRGPSQEQMFGLTAEREGDRSIRELERHIRTHVKRMQERHRNPRGTMTQQRTVTEEDLKEFRKLQARLLERKTVGRHSENPFTIYTDDTWPSFLFK